MKFPLKLLSGLVGNKKKRPKRTEREQKQLKHAQNFDPIHYSWQKRISKKLTKKQWEYYKKKRRSKPNPIKPN